MLRPGGFAPLELILMVLLIPQLACPAVSASRGRQVSSTPDDGSDNATAPPSFVRPPASAMTTYYYDNNTASYLTVPGSVEVVTAEHPTFTPAINVYHEEGMHEVGWDTLYLEIVPSYLQADCTQGYYAAGWVEGVVTSHRIRDMFNNLYPPEDPLQDQASTDVQTFVQAQLSWTSIQATARVTANDSQTAFWKSVQSMQNQLQGLADGYQSVHPEGTSHYLSDFQIFLVNYAFELADLRAHFNETDPNASPIRLERSESIALVKPTTTDLLVGHATWGNYRSMLRQYKVYAFERTVSMSSYPGTIHSGDNFYEMDSGILSMATTFTDFNAQSYQQIHHTSVPAFFRVMAANRVAASGLDWVKNFCTANSGTMNGQFIVVNFNAFNASGTTLLERLPATVLYIVEQLPGLCQVEDVSAVLRGDGYWASYGRPEMVSMQRASGFLQMEAQYGSFFSHDDYALAAIFKRNESEVTDWQSLMRLLRYNGFEFDELSKIPNCTTCPNATCSPPRSPWLSLASRGDLAPVGGNESLGPLYEYLSRSPRGAIDAKVATWSERLFLGAHIISGPTADPGLGIPPFTWSDAPFSSITHHGMPDVFDFGVQNTTQLLNHTPVVEEPGAPQWWILGVAGGAFLLAVVAAIIYKRWQLSREGEEEALLT